MTERFIEKPGKKSNFIGTEAGEEPHPDPEALRVPPPDNGDRRKSCKSRFAVFVVWGLIRTCYLSSGSYRPLSGRAGKHQNIFGT